MTIENLLDAPIGLKDSTGGAVVRTDDVPAVFPRLPATVTNGIFAFENGEPVATTAPFINSGKYDLSARALGLVYDSAAERPNNVAALNAAVQELSDAGGGRIEFENEGTLFVDTPVNMRNNVELDGRGTLIHNTRGNRASFLDTSIFTLGAFARTDLATVYHPYEPTIMVQGSNVLPVADGSTYQPGDMILCLEDDPSYWTTSGGGNPEIIQPAIVVNVVGNTLELDQQIYWDVPQGTGTRGVDSAGAWVANVSHRVSGAFGSGLNDTRHWVHSVKIHDFRLKSNAGAVMRRFGAYRCDINNIEVLDNAYGLFTNGLNNCRLRGWRGTTGKIRLAEFAVGCGHTIVEDFDFTYSPNTGSTEPAEQGAILGENLTNFILRNGQLTFGNEDVPIAIGMTGAKHSTMENITVYSPATVFSTGLSLNGSTNDCIVRNNTIVAKRVAVPLRDNGQDNLITGNTINGEVVSSPNFSETSRRSTVTNNDFGKYTVIVVSDQIPPADRPRHSGNGLAIEKNPWQGPFTADTTIGGTDMINGELNLTVVSTGTGTLTITLNDDIPDGTSVKVSVVEATQEVDLVPIVEVVGGVPQPSETIDGGAKSTFGGVGTMGWIKEGANFRAVGA